MKLKLFILLTTTFVLNSQGFAVNKTNLLKSATHKTLSKKHLTKLKALKAEVIKSKQEGTVKVGHTVDHDVDLLQTINCSEYTSSLVFEKWCMDQKNIEAINIQKLTFCYNQSYSSVSEALCYFGDIKPLEVSSCHYGAESISGEQACMANKKDLDNFKDLSDSIESIIPFEVYLIATEPVRFDFTYDRDKIDGYADDLIEQFKELEPFIDELIEQLIEDDQFLEEPESKIDGPLEDTEIVL